MLKNHSSMDELLDNQNQKMVRMESKKSSSKFNSSSSHQFRLDSSADYIQKSNNDFMDPPRMCTRKSSNDYKPRFINTLDNWKKNESKFEGGFGIFGPDNFMNLDPMLESMNIGGENMGKITEGSVNESGFLKFFKGDSKIEQN